MKTNVKTKHNLTTYEGGPSSPITPLQQLRRLALACMLWEDTFYVDGVTHAELLEKCCERLSGQEIIEVAMEAHKRSRLRHLPLFLIVQALKKGAKCSEAIYEICSRADQMTELLSLYWKEKRKPLAAQLKKGLAKAFTRFDEYQLAKYNRDGAIKLKDILFLCHPKPKDAEQEELWKRLVAGQMTTPDTWETRLSAGEDKKESFEELLINRKIGSLAILRNLRNMHDAGISRELVECCLFSETKTQLPFQYLAAAKACPLWEPMIDKAMLIACRKKETIKGRTVILVDVSGSMMDTLSAKSKMSRMDAACGLAILLKMTCEQNIVMTFSDSLAIVPSRIGMALRDAIISSQPTGATYLGRALAQLENARPKTFSQDRIIVITDEQAHDSIPPMDIQHCYMINVGTYQNGIKNNGQWLTITGFSEHCVDYIREYEAF